MAAVLSRWQRGNRKVDTVLVLLVALLHPGSGVIRRPAAYGAA